MEDEVRMVGGVGGGWMEEHMMRKSCQYGGWYDRRFVVSEEPRHVPHLPSAFVQGGVTDNRRIGGDPIPDQSLSG